MTNKEPTQKQIAYAKKLSKRVGKDLSKVPFTKYDYWKFISSNKNAPTNNNLLYDDAYDLRNYFDLGDFS